MFLPNSLDALIGLYLTPFIANGIRKGIIIALKINTDKIALDGELSPIIFKKFICGIAIVKIAGIIAKYFAISFAIENVVNDPTCNLIIVYQFLLPLIFSLDPNLNLPC